MDRPAADLTLVEIGDGRRVNRCGRGEGVEMFLPDADNIVVIAESRGGVAPGTSDRVRELVGRRMEATGCYRRRRTARSFPDPAEVEVEAIGMGKM